MISLDSIPITHQFFSSLAFFGIPLGPRLRISSIASVFVVVLLIGIYLSHFSRFGRNVYALGGNEQSAVLIGGTLLTGGVGLVEGTLIGVLILGLIQTLISFPGTLSSWWTRIVIGLLLAVFILLQRYVSHTSATLRQQADSGT
jgi:galactofuranose transport system permease protein